MGTGYERKDTGNNIADGNVINASDFDAEFDGLVSAFATSTGHTHDGSTGEGGPVSKLGPSAEYEGDAAAFFPSTTNSVDLGKSAKQFKDLYIDGVINTDDMSADAATITGNVSVGGTLNVGSSASYTGAVSVGSTLAVTGDTDVSNLSANGTLDVAGNASIGGTFQVTGEFNLTDVSASGTLDVAGNGSVGGTFIVTGDTDITNVSANGTLDVSGNASVGGTLAVTGDTDVTNLSANGTLDVSGNASVGGTHKVTGNLTADGDIVNTSGNLTVDPATQIVEIKGNGSDTEGQVQLNCHANTHGQIIKAQPHSESVTNAMLLPKGANSTLVSEVGTATITNKTIDIAPSVSAAGVVNVGTNLSVLGNASVGGTFKITDTVSAEAAVNVGGLLNVVGSAGLAGNVNLGNATADSIVVGGVLTANASANLTGNVGVGGTLTVTDTITGSSTVSDQDGNLRAIPVSQNRSGDYTLAITDAGNQVVVNSANVTITVPTSVFAVGDIISIISVNGCTATLACTAVNAVKAGDLAATALHTLDANGVASIMFSYTADLAVLTGNIS